MGGNKTKFDKLKQENETLNKMNETLNKLNETLNNMSDKLKQENEKLKEENAHLQKDIERRKDQFMSVWREVPLYADWRKEEFTFVNVTLDEDTAHPSLLVRENRKKVRWQKKSQDLPSSPERFESFPCVLGQQKISSGRYYWEVEVKDIQSWDLGVCRDNVARKGSVNISPRNGFWVIRFYEEEYWALTSPETSIMIKEKPCNIGIFLDYEAGNVSFFNMTDGSHIFTFPKTTFNDVLRPFFKLQSFDSGFLTIAESN